MRSGKKRTEQQGVWCCCYDENDGVQEDVDENSGSDGSGYQMINYCDVGRCF